MNVKVLYLISLGRHVSDCVLTSGVHYSFYKIGIWEVFLNIVSHVDVNNLAESRSKHLTVLAMILQ
jgi:hypothetical protein